MITPINPELAQESPPITFSGGLIGLEDWQEFVLLNHPDGDPLKLLQSLQDGRMSLILADPRQIDPGYSVTLSANDIEALQYTGQAKLVWDGVAEVYCILSVQEEPFIVSANMLGPLVINWQTKLGRQIILANSSYSARQLIKTGGA